MNDNEEALNNQQQHWEEMYRARGLETEPHSVSEFAKEVGRLLPEQASLLELGCGPGGDAAYFAQQGHFVEALDFSETAIAQDMKWYEHIPHLTFRVADIRQPFPYGNNRFDAVYAHLSLHYFTDEVTKQIFQEIRRVLQPNGLLAFMCKSTSDQDYGHGTQIEQDMFLKDEHIRHFFTEDYARACLGDGFTIEELYSLVEHGNGEQHGFVKVIARKK